MEDVAQTLTLVSWNVRQGGGRRLAEQIRLIAALAPDVVALQEVTGSSVDRYRLALGDHGLAYSCDTFAGSGNALVGARRYGLLLASRFVLDPLPPSSKVVWPERLLGARITEWHNVAIFTVHVPPGASNGWIKIEVLEGIRTTIEDATRPRILCGDFNAPQAELPDGRVVTWAQSVGTDGAVSTAARIRGAPATRWDAGERWPFDGSTGLVDGYRALHGFGHTPASWILRRRTGDIPRRFDHILADPSIRVVSAEYLQDPLLDGISDHAPLVAQVTAPA